MTARRVLVIAAILTVSAAAGAAVALIGLLVAAEELDEAHARDRG